MIPPTLLVAAVILLVSAADPSSDWISLLSRASGPVLMAIIIVGAIRRDPWWVPGTLHRQVVKERDDLLGLALRSTHATERVLSLAERGPPAAGPEGA